MTTYVNIYEAKAHLSKLIAQVQATGQAITICRNKKPVVDLIPHKEPKDPLQQDPELTGARFKGDPCAPVSEEDWPREYR